MVVRGNPDGPGKKLVAAEAKKAAAASKGAAEPKAAKTKAKSKDGKSVAARTAALDDGQGNVKLPEAAKDD